MAKPSVSKKLLILNSASSGVSMALDLTVLVWLQQYLVKRIPTEEYSLIPLVLSLMAFGPLIDATLTGGIGRYVTAAYAQEDDESITAIASTMFPILMVFGLAGLVVSFLLGWNINHIIRVEDAQLNDARIMFILSACTLCIKLPLGAFMQGLVVRQLLMYEDLLSIGSQFIKFALLFSLMFGLGPRALWVVVATQVAEIVRLFVIAVASQRALPSQRFSRGYFRWSLGKEILNYGSWFFVTRGAAAMRVAFDPLLLNRFASALQVATFHIGGLAPRQVQGLLFPLVRPFIPVMATLYAQNDYERMRTTYLRAARYHIWVVFTVALPASFFGKQVMHLYIGDEYPDAGAVMSLLVWVPVLRSYNSLGEMTALAVARVKELALRQSGAVIGAVIVSVFFVVVLDAGAIGAAIAGVVSASIVEAALVWTFCRDLIELPVSAWIRKVVIPTIAPAVPPALLCLAALLWVPLDSWVSVLSVSAASAVVYWGLLIRFFMQPEDRNDLERVFDRLPRKLGDFMRGLIGSKKLEPRSLR